MAGFDNNTRTDMDFARFAEVLDTPGTREAQAYCGVPILDPGGARPEPGAFSS